MAKQINPYQKKQPPHNEWRTAKPHKEPHHPEHSPEHLLEKFFRRPPVPIDLQQTPEKWLEPDIEIIETAKDVIVSAELPGMNPDDIEVNISQDGYLTISGEKQHHIAESDEQTGTYFSEFSYGTMQRTVPLPADLKYDDVSACFENGVLSVKIPKTEDAARKVKKVPVQKK